MKQQHVQKPMIFDETILQQRQQAARDNLLTGVWTGYDYRHPCADISYFNAPDFLLDFVEQMGAIGRKRYPHFIPSIHPLHYVVAYYKSQDEIDIVLKASDEEVKAAYLQEIEDHNKVQLELLADQIYQIEQKKIEDAVREAAMKEAAVLRAEALKMAEKQFKSQQKGAK